MEAEAEFDIRTLLDRDRLAQHHIASDRQDQLKADEIVNGLASVVRHLGARDWMIWRYGGFVVPTGRKSQRFLDVVQAVELGQALEVVSRCDGFTELLTGFENPTQLDDAIFEAQMARWCFERPTITALRFAPRYTVLGRAKRPDFELQTPIGRLVCECQRLHLHTQDWATRLTSLADAFEAAMRDAQIPDDMRLEVTVNRVIHGDLRVAADHACCEVTKVSAGTALEVGPFSVRLSPIGSPVAPSDCLLQHGRIRVGTTPTGITPENNYLRVSSPWMERAVVRTMGAVINVAHRQLPHDRAGVIFVDGPRREGRQAAAMRLLQREYAHCLAIAVVRQGEVEFSRRNIDEAVVDWLFLGKTPSLGRRLQYIVSWRSGRRLARLRKMLRPATSNVRRAIDEKGS